MQNVTFAFRPDTKVSIPTEYFFSSAPLGLKGHDYASDWLAFRGCDWFRECDVTRSFKHIGLLLLFCFSEIIEARRSNP